MRNIHAGRSQSKLWIVVVFALLTGCLPIQAQESVRDPILIVPGFGASWNSDVMLGNVFSDKWNFFLGVHQYDPLIEALEDIGLERDKDFYVVFYDWRKNNFNSAIDYLEPAIDKALEDNPGADKVDIIAHSMGGLVARSYIHGSRYRNDVSDYISLGTPHRGSSDVYTMWEGGIIPENWDKLQRFALSTYIWKQTVATAATEDAYDTIHQQIPSIGEMMPTYDDYLYDPTTYVPEEEFQPYIGLDDMVEKNIFLQNLNQSIGPFGSGFLAQVDSVTTIAGTGEATVDDIPIKPFEPAGPEEEKLWVDGIPEPLSPTRNNTDGDNRVIVDSAQLFLAPPILSQTVPEKEGIFVRIAKLFADEAKAQATTDATRIVLENVPHGALPTEAIDEIFDILDLDEPAEEYAVAEEPDNILSFTLASPLSIKITDPNGNVVSATENGVDGAHYDAQTDPLGVKMITILNPIDGEYTVEMEGLANGSYHLGIGNTGDNDYIETVEGDVESGEGIGYTVEYDADSATPTSEVSEPFPIGEVPTTIVGNIDALHADLKSYYSNGDLKGKSQITLLSGLLKLAKVSVETFEKLAEKRETKLVKFQKGLARAAAIWNVEEFISKVKQYKKLKFIKPAAADDLILTAAELLVRIKAELI